MAHFKKKPFRNIATWILTIGAVSAIGFLGFSGAFLIYASIPLGAAVFIFSGAIEETVYGESIYKGLGRLKLIGSKGKHNFFILALDNYLDDFIIKNSEEALIDQKNENFLKDYYLLKKYYKKLKKNNLEIRKINETKIKLNELRNYIYTKAIQKEIDSDDSYLGELQSINKDLLHVAKRNLWVLRSTFLVSLAVGLGAGLITASAMNTALLSLGVAISLTTLSAIVWPIAILATAATVFLLYKNMTDFFKEESAAIETLKITGHFIRKLPSKIWQRICQLPSSLKSLFRLSETVSIKVNLITFIRNFFKFTLGVIVLGLTLFAACASLFTCGAAIKSGLALIPGVPLILIAIVCPILITLSFATDLTYGLSTTSETIQALFSIRFSDIKIQLVNKFNLLLSQESFLQLFNPFRLIVNTINGLFKLLVFSAHVLSIGITTDNLGKIPPVVVAIGCALPEALQDASFFIGRTNQAHEHDHGGWIMRSLILVKNIILMASLIWVFDAFWNWTFKQSDNKLTLKKALSDSIQRCCELEKHQHQEDPTPLNTISPSLSTTWTEEKRLKLKLGEAIKRLDNAIIDRKLAKKKQKVLTKVLKHSGDIISDIKKSIPIGAAINNQFYHQPVNGFFKKSATHVLNEVNDQDTAFGILSRQRSLFVKNTQGKPTSTTEGIINEVFSDFVA